MRPRSATLATNVSRRSRKPSSPEYTIGDRSHSPTVAFPFTARRTVLARSHPLTSKTLSNGVSMTSRLGQSDR